MDYLWKLPTMLPVVLPEKKMEFRRYQKGEPTQVNRFGIPEPTYQHTAFPDDHTAILVPCLAMDRSGNRLGMGGGYYDRFLSQYPDCFKVALVFPFQVSSSELPVEKTDVKMNAYYDGMDVNVF